MSRRLFTRMAARDAWRNKWRSLLMVVMVALPVAAVTALDVVVKTADVRPGEAMSRTIGAADARVSFEGGTLHQKGIDWTTWSSSDTGSMQRRPVSEVLGRPVADLPLYQLSAPVDTDRGRVTAIGLATDWSSPLITGITRLKAGRVPRGPGEVAINQALADKTAGLGGQITSGTGTYTVVGLMEHAIERTDAMLFAAPSSTLIMKGTTPQSWFLGGTDGVTWADTQTLNAAGYTVASAELAAHPPADSELAPEVLGSDAYQQQMLAVLALVVVMVLLAGPGFAVTARRMQRSLALMSVSGATPRQARGAVMAMAWVMGALAAVLGVGLGVLAAWLALRFGQPYAGQWLAPMQIPWRDVALVAGFGVLAALLAAWGPARLAARQDPVATLNGRRADPPSQLRSPAVGLLLLGVGIGLAVLGARQAGNGEFTIALAAVACVVGMVLVLPVTLSGVGKVAGRLPLTGRYAVRDAARHRSRTVPAIAAVAATVAAAVALSVGLASDAAEEEATYQASYPMGTTVLLADDGDLSAARSTVDAVAPGLKGHVVRGVGNGVDVSLEGVGEDDLAELQFRGAGSAGTSTFVGNSLPQHLEATPEQRRLAEQALARGEVLVFSPRALTLSRQPQLSITNWDDQGSTQVDEPRTIPVKAAVVVVADRGPISPTMMSPATAQRLKLPVRDALAVYPSSGLSKSDQQEIEERIAPLGSFYLATERGYQPDSLTAAVTWSLVAAAAVLMLGGTLTSTLLSLSDARADLSTLAAVGAAPRTRRRIAVWYAVLIGGMGAVMGTLVGLIPGVAVSYPLTRGFAGGGPGADEFRHYLDIPWPVLGVLILALPLLSAAVMALFTRSRLPLLARAD